jgi:GntR family transcriptional regulator
MTGLDPQSLRQALKAPPEVVAPVDVAQIMARGRRLRNRRRLAAAAGAICAIALLAGGATEVANLTAAPSPRVQPAGPAQHRPAQRQPSPAERRTPLPARKPTAGPLPVATPGRASATPFPSGSPASAPTATESATTGPATAEPTTGPTATALPGATSLPTPTPTSSPASTLPAPAPCAGSPSFSYSINAENGLVWTSIRPYENITCGQRVPPEAVARAGAAGTSAEPFACTTAPVTGTPMTDSALALPLYHQVAGILRQRIEDGSYPVGWRLRSEGELAQEFEVSRATIRQAMGALETEGLVVRRRGRGTFVESAGQPVLKQRLRGSLSDLMAESHRTTTRDVDVTHDAAFPAYIADALHLPGARGTIASRTRMRDGEPFCYTVTYLPPEIGEQAVSADGLRRTALLKLLVEHGIALHTATQSIRAQLADPGLCGRIDVELGAPVLYVERTLYDAAGQPVDFVRSWYRGDRYEYTVTLSLDPVSQAGPYIDLA